ncbi:uncharacterized protein LOC110731119 [Chenopodium quinoa]|uniref:uncharacterized protein LOC110731119 n=1 Tax=Chenopodium quinoa TaxID=63459 RepID=UPI000B797D27|nr:uncharacterized protein LOC110731119 [Chenopodium quinoa]
MQEEEDSSMHYNNQTQQDEAQASLFAEGTLQPNRIQLNMHQKRDIVDAMLLKMQDALNISHVTLHYLKKKGRLRTHTASSKPALTSYHKVVRMKWVLSHINLIQGNENPTFEDMQYTIHIDEKWFYLNPNKRRFYLLPSKEDPYMAQQSRRFKLKVMFMAIIGKPLYGRNGELLYDGKYEIFPFTQQEMAKKSSKNRPAGTLVTKATQNVNREAIRHMLLNKVILAIVSKWLESVPKNVVIQWDNVRPHQIPTDEEFIAATQAHGFNI